MTGMPEPNPPKAKPPHPGVLIGRIRALVKQGAFSWGTHVFERSTQRDIDIHDATEVLRLGEIEGPIEPGVNPGSGSAKSRRSRTNHRAALASQSWSFVMNACSF